MAGSKLVNRARAAIGCCCRICAFFHHPDDAYKILLPFITEGIDAGDRPVQIIDRRQRVERLHQLTEASVDAEAAEQSGQLEMRSWAEAQLLQYFSASLIMDILLTHPQVIVGDSFGRIRFTCRRTNSWRSWRARNIGEGTVST